MKRIPVPKKETNETGIKEMSFQCQKEPDIKYMHN